MMNWKPTDHSRLSSVSSARLLASEQNSFCRVNLELLRSDIGLMYGLAARRKRFSSICRCGSCINVSGLTLERVMSALDQKSRALRILVKRNKLDIRQQKYLAMTRVINRSYWLLWRPP